MAVKKHYISRSTNLQFVYYGSIDRIVLNGHNEAVIEFEGDLTPITMKIDSQEYIDFMLGFEDYLDSDGE